MMTELLANNNREVDHLPELTLAPSPRVMVDRSVNSSGLLTLVESRKRKFDDHLMKNVQERALVESSHASVDLQVKDPLPLDWEQYLDLQSGKMYYQNRRTLRKTSKCPKDDHHHHYQPNKLDLELNISTFSNRSNVPTKEIIKDTMFLGTSSSSTNMDMVALPCMNCHLLVIVSKSSPTCPNCKYIDHTLLHSKQQQIISLPRRHESNNAKSLLTLSLLK